MHYFRALMVVATLGIYVLTVIAIQNSGWNWPAVAIHDLAGLDWRTQFDFDFIVYLLIFALWLTWREGLTLRTHLLALFSIVMGGMFSFPYLLYLSYRHRGDAKAMLLGVHVNSELKIEP